MRVLYSIILILCLYCGNVLSQESLRISKDFNRPDFSIQTVNHTDYLVINKEKGMFCGKNTGQADLPSYNFFVDVPDCDSVIIKNLNIITDTVFLGTHHIIPKQPSKIKAKEDTAFVIDERYYMRESFGEEKYVTIEKQGVMGKHKVACISIAPYRYNPIKNILETVKHIDFELSYVNIQTKQKTNPHIPYRYIIVSDEIFADALSPFIQWKKQQGFDVISAYTQQIGKTKEEIYSYLENLYLTSSPLNPSADYLLIVGDTGYVPSFLGNFVIDTYPKHYTDFYYTDYTDDMLPDVLSGRISVKDTSELKNIITKTLNYEKWYMDSTAFINSVLMVAGKETGNNAQYFTNGQLNYIKDYFAASVDTNIFYNPTSTTSENKSAIRSCINKGNGWVIYSGHGTVTGWQNPQYRIKDIDTAMVETGKYGIYINNCCHSGKYYDSSGFTYSLLKAQNKGAVASVGACDYTTWEEDFYWSVGAKQYANKGLNYDANALGVYDRLVHSNGESYQDWVSDMGQVVCAGNLAVEQSLSDFSNYYWEVYNLQGDPSLMPYIGAPKKFDIKYDKTVTLGTDKISFTAPPYSYAALTYLDEIVSVCLADSTGCIELDISNVSEPKGLMLVVTGQFYQPFIDSVYVISDNKPYIALKDLKIRKQGDEYSTDCSNLEQGQKYSISFTIINSGNKALQSSDNSIKIKSDAVEFSVSDVNFPPLASKDTIAFDKAFYFTVKPGLDNYTVAEFDIEISSSDNEINNHFSIKKEVIAPKVNFGNIALKRINDTILLDIELINKGMMVSDYGTFTIDFDNTVLDCEQKIKDVPMLSFLQSEHLYYYIYIKEKSLDYFAVQLVYTDGTYTENKDLNLNFAEMTDGFEEGFTYLDWIMDENRPWVIDSNVYYSGNGSARSSKNIKDNQKSRLSLTIDSDVSFHISFYVKVSSEKDYDKLKFFIDNEEKFALHGEIPWQKRDYDITNGSHTLCFSYEKDYELFEGADAAWIDDFVIRIGSDSITLDVNDIAFKEMMIIPNPARDYIQLNNLSKGSNIMIVNQSGLTVFSYIAENDTETLDIRNIESGVYVVVIDGKKINKLIVIK